MKKGNIIIILSILILLCAFLLGFLVAESIKSNNNINSNINNINIGKEEQKININTADKPQLMSIEGIGDKKSDLIINNRPYNSIWDLEKIDGISKDFIKKNEGRLIT